MSKNAQKILICLALAALTVALFWPVKHHEFINYDDPDYVSANPVTQGGLTWPGIQWAFTTTHSFNWHPLTWISHMVDFQLFGNNPGAHHLVSVFFHLASALLIFWLLQKTTGAVWRSAFVAAVFAVHPLHVESVAWACERKDVLSTFFGLISILFYVRHVQRRSVGSAGGKVGKRESGKKPTGSLSHSPTFYVMALVFFLLSLLSKPMLVTLPFLLLLLDLWPLKRIAVGAAEFRVSLRRLLREKIPFFLFTLASCIVTYFAQKKEGAVVELEYFPVGARIGNALVSYIRYLGKTFWPADLTIYYEPTPTWAFWRVAVACLILFSVSIAAFLWWRKRPYFFSGWFWFLGTLVPVIGLVQVGGQSIAERYMYVPMIGLSIALVWGASEWPVLNDRFRKWILGVVGVWILIASFVVSHAHVRHWKNSETVFRHALTVSPTNLMAHVMLANTLCDAQKVDEAEFHFREALKINPRYPEIHFNLGNLFVQTERLDKAVTEFEAALAQNPNYIEAHANLAVVLSRQNKFEEALEHEKFGLKLDSRQPDLWRNMAIDLMSLGRFDEAVQALKSAIDLQPAEPILYLLLGNAYAAQQKLDEAAQNYSLAIRLKPDFAEAQQRLQNVLARKSGAAR